MKIPALDSWNLRKAVQQLSDDAPDLALDLLLQLHPVQPTAKALMYHYGGSDYSKNPLTAFVRFNHVYRNINRLIAPLGYVVRRSGGQPHDKYWLEKFE